MPGPATEHSFSEAPPDRIYWDTNFVLSAILADDTNHARCLGFAESLLAAGTRIVYSQATVIECIIKCRKLAVNGFLPIQSQAILPLDQSSVFSHSLTEWERTLRSFLRQFRDCWEVNITKSVLKRVFPIIRQHGLHTFDAIHLATMQHVGCSHIACLDADFRDISGLHLWNDLIFG